MKAPFQSLTGDQYDKLVHCGVLTRGDHVELLEGYLVLRVSECPSHDEAANVLTEVLSKMVPDGWVVRSQSTAKLTESRPEPDALACGDRKSFAAKHPVPADFALVVEVSESSLARDELDKTRIYARDSIPVYWVVNLVDRRVEVFTDPTGPDVPAGAADPDPHYRSRRDYPAGTAVPVVLDGVAVGAIPVDELLP